MSRVTLQSIANQLGISKFAVSRALTGKPGVSEETRRTVVATAERLGYIGRPSKPADVRSFEVLFHDRTVANRELWVDVQNGIEEEASRHGYPMAIRWSNDHTLIERLERTTIGFVLVGPHERKLYEAARDSRIPAITVSHVVPALDTMDQVTATDVEAGARVADFLIGLGHRRLVYVHGRLGYPGRHARLRGFSEAIGAVEETQLREIAFEEDQAGASFSEALMAMVNDHYEPTGFFCGSDNVALTVVSELMRIGLEIPEDVSVVGHADYPIATQISPKLTTVHMPHREMGVAAVRMLLARAGFLTPLADAVPMRIGLVPHLLVRQTTGPATTASWRWKLRSNGTDEVSTAAARTKDETRDNQIESEPTQLP